MGEIRLRLNESEMAELNKPINGQGGLQSFGRRLQTKLQVNGNITLTDGELGRVLRHISYKPGGFENRLATAFSRSIQDILE